MQVSISNKGRTKKVYRHSLSPLLVLLQLAPMKIKDYISLRKRNRGRGGKCYSRASVAPFNPYTEAKLTIQPLSPQGRGSCLTICPVAYLQPRKVPRALTSKVWSQSSMGFSQMVVVCVDSMAVPALLTMLSVGFWLESSEGGMMRNKNGGQ